MKNFEKYIDEVSESFLEELDCNTFISKVHAPWICSEVSCHECAEKLKEFLLSDYKKPPVDWSKVKVDTPILASDDGITWRKRYFAKYDENGQVYTWSYGTTSWSADDEDDTVYWEYAKLAEEEQEDE